LSTNQLLKSNMILTRILSLFVIAFVVQANCDDLLTLSVARDKTIKYEKFVKYKKKKPYFILGVSDGNCEKCCQTEPLLKELENMTESGILSLTEDAKGGKWEGKRVHKKIPIMRVDVAD
jgi:hypothetical protein